eukprot:TRINITY_DN808_c0_g1_i6.p3 TRINITY_DN808_c0_g1~~TRINITY_DN808_c0_g1_i6.p3  ORF type:complete len:103 (+),score=0.21 TRINITY_DN808_c0_g1_i6:1316-1624(+)
MASLLSTTFVQTSPALSGIFCSASSPPARRFCNFNILLLFAGAPCTITQSHVDPSKRLRHHCRPLPVIFLKNHVQRLGTTNQSLFFNFFSEDGSILFKRIQC